jgi:hypothetical protein
VPQIAAPGAVINNRSKRYSSSDKWVDSVLVNYRLRVKTTVKFALEIPNQRPEISDVLWFKPV